MSFLERITARQLGLAALAIWCSSLAFTGFVIYAGQNHFRGLEILLIGWLSPVMLNFAWFANIFFLYAIFRLLSGGAPTWSAILASLLSFDTFRFSQYLLNEGGSTSQVYGYGWGAVLWFISIFIMLIATGTQRREINRRNRQYDRNEWLRPLGFVLLSVTLGTVLYFAVHDRIFGNFDEIQRLSHIAFKRGKVCGVAEPVVANPVQSFHGPVEIVVEKYWSGMNNPFPLAEDLLAWGIPTVRIGNNDYSYVPGEHNDLLSSLPASGAPAAILFINKSYTGGDISMKLMEVNTNRTVFEQVWVREDHPVNIDYYCPHYRTFPTADEQPRNIIMQALGIRSIPDINISSRHKTEHVNKIDGNIIHKTSSGITLEMKFTEWRKMHPNVPYHETRNINCPRNIGWDGSNYEPKLNSGWPFMVKDKAYYFKHSINHNAICDGESVYIYSGISRYGQYSINVEERNLHDFQRMWSGSVTIDGVAPSIRDDALVIHSFKKTASHIMMELIDENSGEVLTVQAPFQNQ